MLYVMEKSLDVVMENGENLLRGQNLLSTTVDVRTGTRDMGFSSSNGCLHLERPTDVMDSTITTETNQTITDGLVSVVMVLCPCFERL